MTDNDAEKIASPAYYDFEMERRKWRRTVWGAVLVTSAVSLTVSLGSILIALGATQAAKERPTPVVVFDSQGRPIVFTETVRPALEPDRVRVKHFAKTLIDHWVCVDSTRISEDIKQSLSMMTRGLQEHLLAEGKAIARREKYRDGNTRSHVEGLELRIGDFDPELRKQKIGLYAWGKLVFEPVQGEGDPQELFMFVEANLVRTPVSEAAPWGLLADYVEFVQLEDAKALELQLIKKRRS